MITFVVTGFGKFQDVLDNPTTHLVSWLQQQVESGAAADVLGPGVQVRSTAVLQVAARDVDQYFAALVHELQQEGAEGVSLVPGSAPPWVPPYERPHQSAGGEAGSPEEAQAGGSGQSAGAEAPSESALPGVSAAPVADAEVEGLSEAGAVLYGTGTAGGPHAVPGGQHAPHGRDGGGAAPPPALPVHLGAHGEGAGRLRSRQLVLLHLGVAYKAEVFRLEDRAANCADFRYPDERGWQPKDTAIDAGRGCQACIPCALPLEALRQRLAAAGYGGQVEVSEDAGRFLCNYSYYRSLTMGERCGWRSLFLHVPLFETIGEEVQRSFLLELMKQLALMMEEAA